MTGKRHLLDQDLLRTMTVQQLHEHKTIIDQLCANFPNIPGTRLKNPAAVSYVADYYFRTTGFEQALEFLNTQGEKQLGQRFYATKMEFLIQHERSTDLENYIQDLLQRKTSKPHFLLLCMKHYLSLGQRQRAAYFLSRLLTERPQSAKIIDAMILATTYDIDFDQVEFKKNIDWGEKFLALKKKIFKPGQNDSLSVLYCINLDSSTKRMSQCTHLYRDKVELRRIPGVLGSTLPEKLLKKTCDNPNIPKSAVGCALSHISAWEKIAENSESALPTMIIEDDGLPLMFDGTTYNIVQKLMQQQNIDLLFVNESATPLEFSIREFSTDWTPEILTFEIGIERFFQHKKDLLPGWGMYGYILSSLGAKKLLGLLDRDGLCNHIDWQAFLYSASNWNHPVVNSKKIISVQYQRATGRKPQCELKSGILNFPMITHIDFFNSTR